MYFFDRDYRRQRKRSRLMLQAYRRNGWQCPWIKRNSLKDILRRL